MKFYLSLVIAFATPVLSLAADQCNLVQEKASAYQIRNLFVKDLDVINKAIADIEKNQALVMSKGTAMAKEAQAIYKFELKGLNDLKADFIRHIESTSRVAQSENELQSICNSNKK